MESLAHEENCTNQPLLNSAARPTGGSKTLPFIILNEALEKVASYGLSSNMTRYLTGDYGMSTAGASYVLSLWSAAANFTPVIGAFLADSCVGRYTIIGFGSVVCVLGMLVLWLTAAVPGAKNYVLLYTSLGLMSVGAGGLRSSSMAFGADQLKKGGILALESYVSWYFASTTASVLVGLSLVVYIQDTMGWTVGFGLPVVLMFLSALSFFLVSSSYVKAKPSPSLIAGLLQVAVASYKKRGLRFPSPELDDDVIYHNPTASTRLAPSHRLRFLNVACIVRNSGTELTREGRASDPWSLCSVEQVEGLKALIRIIPIWSTGIIFVVPSTPNALSYLQVASMDRHITPNFEVPVGSFPSFSLVFMTIWVLLYDRLLIPLASKIMGRPVRLDVKLKMGFGIIFMILSLVVGAAVESCRRALVIEAGFSDDPDTVVNMSLLVIAFSGVLLSLGEASNAIGQNEFYLSELPTTMSSVATTLFGLNMFVGNLVSSCIMMSVDNLTKTEGEESWVSSNINKAHFDYYIWLLCGFNVVNFFYFLLCCKGYSRHEDEEDDISS